jgi:putative ABC transport system permease protein
LLIQYLRNVYRRLFRTRINSIIQIAGLAVAMASSLLILHYVFFETGYDTFHPDHQRIYRLRCERTTQEGTTARFASCCPAAGPLIRERYPQVERLARIIRYPASVSYENRIFTEEKMFFAEPDFLDIFPFPFLSGNPRTGLRQPNTAFIAASTARKYFGDADPMGRTISVDKKTQYKITGVFADLPVNTHLRLDILLSYPNLLNIYGKEIEESWGHTGFFTYIRMRPGADAAAFESKLPELVQAEFGEVLREYRLHMSLLLQPLKDIHLHSNYMQEYEIGGNAEAVRILAIIALIIILIAWINYINLATAGALQRAREIGLRKAVGAGRRQIIGHSLLETSLVNLVASLLALLLISLFLPLFDTLTGSRMGEQIWSQPWFWLTLGVLLVAGVILSGIHPALVLAGFRPADALYRHSGLLARGLNLRQLLVLVQFIIALFMITITFTLFEQLSFMKSQDLGFNPRSVLTVKAPRVRQSDYLTTFNTFKDLLLQKPEIKGITHVTEVPGRQILWDAGGIFRQGADISHSKNYKIVGIDDDFLDVFDLAPLHGRNFKREYAADHNALLVNELAAKWLGFDDPRSALEQKVNYWGDIYTIVGVLPNYHQQSPRNEFEPLLYRYMPTGRDVRGMFAIRFSGTDPQEVLDIVRPLYLKFFPDNAFDYFFLEDYFNQQYLPDERFGMILTCFSGIAIMIMALGIFGLSLFNTSQRTREIAIRKVLGAGVPRIIRLLLKDMIILLLAAFVIALPLLVIILRRWLEQYALRVDLHARLFYIPLLLVILVTLLTVIWQTWRTASTNPAESLKYE